MGTAVTEQKAERSKTSRARKDRKDKYWSKTAKTAGPWDCVIIGSGMGGMTAAAMLTRLGKRVLVLEQHYVPGGFTHVFKRPGYEWDVGVHAVGEVTLHTLTGRLLADLTDRRLEWASLGPVYDEFLFPDDFKIDFPNSPGQYRENLVEAFPREAEAIDEYIRLAHKTSNAMGGYFLARALPQRFAKPADFLLSRRANKILAQKTQSVVNGLTSDPRLRTLFAAQWGYYGSPPSRSSFAMQALVVKHFLHGGYYPVGGSSEIARQLLRTVSDGGGWTRISCDVDQIMIEGGRAVGVRLADGEEIRAGRVISAAGVMSTVHRLLPEAYQNAPWARSIEKLNPASAHVCLYMGFKGDIREAGAGSANKWFYQTWSTEDEAWMVGEGAEKVPKAGVLYTSFPSLKDPTYDAGPEQRHTGEIVTFVPWERFEKWRTAKWKKRGPEYEAFKGRLRESLLEQLFAHMPRLRGMLDFAELSTPVSTEHFVRPMRGSIYGIEPTPERFANPWLRPRSPIPNLLFAGSEVSTVGVIGAMMGGVLAATTAEPIAALRYLRKM